MSSLAKVAIVTGANQGLGFALVEELCKTLGNDAIVYLTARNVERGKAAVSALETKGYYPQFHHLDVADPASVTAFSKEIEKRHGGVDIVISNAAARISREKPQSEQVLEFVETNNHGTYRMIKGFGSILNEGGRFLVVASSFGSLQKLPQHLHEKFDIETKSLEEIEAVMDEWAESVVDGTAKDKGWPDWINVPSKIGQVASTKILAREMRQEEETKKDILINAVCPGLVNTAASRPWFDDMSNAPSPAEAAVDVVWLATLPLGSTEVASGELIQKRKVIPWL